MSCWEFGAGFCCSSPDAGPPDASGVFNGRLSTEKLIREEKLTWEEVLQLGAPANGRRQLVVYERSGDFVSRGAFDNVWGHFGLVPAGVMSLASMHREDPFPRVAQSPGPPPHRARGEAAPWFLALHSTSQYLFLPSCPRIQSVHTMTTSHPQTFHRWPACGSREWELHPVCVSGAGRCCQAFKETALCPEVGT